MDLTIAHLGRLRRALLARIHRRFQTVIREADFGPVKMDFLRIADPDRVLDEVAAEEDRLDKLAGGRRSGDLLHLPYWAELWESAFGVGHLLAGPNRPAELARPADVLDLGCGMGLAGAVAAAVGHRVLFGDIERPALLFAAYNSLPWRQRIRTRQTNWRTDDLGQRFDAILGADILYERVQWEPLDAFWRKHLTPAGVIILGEPGRQTGDAFPNWIAHSDWRMRIVEQPIPQRPKPIRLFLLRRP